MMRVIRQRLRRWKRTVLDKLDSAEQEALADWSRRMGGRQQQPRADDLQGKTKLPE